MAAISCERFGFWQNKVCLLNPPVQNPAIRDRHWQQLVTATRVTFMMSEDTSLADLLSLNLHNFEDEVHNIVDKAIKEMAMERMLKESSS